MVYVHLSNFLPYSVNLTANDIKGYFIIVSIVLFSVQQATSEVSVLTN